MGILEKLLTAQTAAGVSSINGVAGVTTLAATLPLALSTVGQVHTLSIQAAGQQRGALLHRYASSWGVLNAGNVGQFLKSNGSGSDLSWSDPPIAPTPPPTGRAVLTSLTGSSSWSVDVRLDGDIILESDQGSIKYNKSGVLYDVLLSDGISLTLGNLTSGGPASTVMVRGSTSVELGAGVLTGFRTQLVVFPDYVRVNGVGTLTNPNAGGRGVWVIADAEVVPNLTPVGGVTAYSEAGRFKVRSTGGTIKHVVSPWGTLTNSATRFLSSTSGATFTGTAVQTRTLEIGGDTVQVVCLT